MSNQESVFVNIVPEFVSELGCSIELPFPMKIEEQLLGIVQVAMQELIDVGIIAFPTLRKEASEQRREAY